MSGYSAEDYQVLFDTPTGEQTLDELRKSRRHISNYRAQTIIAGDALRIEAFPIWNTRAEARRAAREKERRREAQARLNDRNLKKKIERRANASFTPDDLFGTFTYEGLEPDEAQARRDMRNLLRRIKTYRKRHGLPEMRWISCIEWGDKEGKRKRIHAHLLVSGMDRDALEAMWPHGRANTRRLQPDDHGLDRIVAYMLKAKRSTRRVSCSRNIVEPDITVSNKRISRRKVERLAAGLPGVAREVFEQLYPGWQFVEVDVRTSQFVAGAYIYAKMRRRE